VANEAISIYNREHSFSCARRDIDLKCSFEIYFIAFLIHSIFHSHYTGDFEGIVKILLRERPCGEDRRRDVSSRLPALLHRVRFREHAIMLFPLCAASSSVAICDLLISELNPTLTHTRGIVRFSCLALTFHFHFTFHSFIPHLAAILNEMWKLWAFMIDVNFIARALCNN
jgi:hypothetical protein